MLIPSLVRPDREPRPVVKWAGGKRETAKRYGHLFPEPSQVAGYHDLFIGAGGMFFTRYRAVRRAVLADKNPRVIALFRAVRDHLPELLEELERHPYDRAHFEQVRHRLNTEPEAPLVERAVWMMVICLYGYNGLYRENAGGGCNVAFGRPPKAEWKMKIAKPDELAAASAALQDTVLLVGDFQHISTSVPAEPGEFVYLDPPYAPVSSTANFAGYTAGGFGPRDLGRLVHLAAELDARGVLFGISESDTRETRELFKRWHIHTIELETNIRPHRGSDKQPDSVQPALLSLGPEPPPPPRTELYVCNYARAA